MANWTTNASSVGEAGSCSASREFSRLVKSASLSPFRTMVSAVSPCVTPFRRTAARPSGVLGPVLFCAFSRLAAVCLSVATVIPLCPIVAGGSKEYEWFGQQEAVKLLEIQGLCFFDKPVTDLAGASVRARWIAKRGLVQNGHLLAVR